MMNNQWEFEPSKNDLQDLREWLTKMPHIVQDYDDQFLAAFVRGCKGRLPKTKSVLENFNSLGIQYPYLFGDLDPSGRKLQEFLSVTRIFPLPKRLEDGALVSMALTNFDNEDSSKFHSLELFRYFLQWLYIYLWENDYGPGKLVLILDNKNISMTHFRGVTPVVMMDLIRILQTSLPLRPKAIHVINLSPSVAGIFNLLKLLCPKKFKNKMHFHSTMETLHKMIPKEILPKEYGGLGENVSTLFNQWKKHVESYKDRLIEENLKMRRLNSIRPKSNDAGNPSKTFSLLNID